MRCFHHRMEDYHREVRIRERQDSIHLPKFKTMIKNNFCYEKHGVLQERHKQKRRLTVNVTLPVIDTNKPKLRIDYANL